jgi:TPR repeat protein
LLHKDGIFSDEDHGKTFELSKESAEGEYSDGINMVGECYYYGIGTEEDKRKALESFKKAANLGNSNAKYNLARMYKNGEIVEKDVKQANELFKSSAQVGYSNLMNFVERNYYNISESENKKLKNIGEKIRRIEDADNYEEMINS